MSYKLHTKNIPGNLHDAATWINMAGWAEYIVTMTTVGGYTIAVFKMPAQMVHNIRRFSGFIGNVEGDNKCWYFDEEQQT